MQSQVSPSSCLRADLVGRRDECRARARGWGLPLSGTGPDSFLSRKLRPWERGKVCLELQFGQWTFALYLGGSSKVSGQDFCALVDLRQFAVTQSSSKTHPRCPCSLAKGIAVG